MSQRVTKMRAALFSHTPLDWQAYHALLARHLTAGMTVLDVGCGTGDIAPFPWRDYPTVTVVGMDPNPLAARNPQLSRFVLLEDEAHWPVEDQGFDLVVARYVLEHVAVPPSFFANVGRVLKSGGYFLFLTPNMHHPAMVAARYLSRAIKTKLVNRAMKVSADDVFPTHYRLNTTGRIRTLAQQHHFRVEYLATKEHQPTTYLDFHVIGFLLAYRYYLAMKRSVRLEQLLGESITGSFRRE